MEHLRLLVQPSGRKIGIGKITIGILDFNLPDLLSFLVCIRLGRWPDYFDRLTDYTQPVNTENPIVRLLTIFLKGFLKGLRKKTYFTVRLIVRVDPSSPPLTVRYL